MKSTLLAALFLVLSPLGLSARAEVTPCDQAVENYFATPVGKAQREKILKIQAQLTLNRLAWAFLKKAQNSNQRFSVEMIIKSILKEKQNDQDPEFQKAVREFEKAPLSRQSLARVSPFIGEILKDQADHAESEFIINQSDVKLLDILALHENGDSRFLTQSRSGEMNTPSILNFAKIINSTFRESDPANFSIDLSKIQDRIHRTLLRLETETASLKQLEGCKNTEPDVCVNCVAGQTEDPQRTIEGALNTSLEALSGDKNLYNGLRFGDLWLSKAKNKAPTNSKNIEWTKTKKIITDDRVPAYFKNPIHVIVQDKKGRERKNFETFEEDYLEVWAKSIFENHPTFYFKNQVHDRKTGKVISFSKWPEPMKAYLEPKEVKLNRNFSIEMKAKAVSAVMNHQPTFVHEGKLYDSNWLTVRDSVQIIIQDRRKSYGVNRKPADYSGMDPVYLSHQANAISNKTSSFFANGLEYDTRSGRQISSPILGATREDSPQDYLTYQNERKKSSHLSNLDVVIDYEKDQIKKGSCATYGVVDKAEASLTVYTKAGQKLWSTEVLVGSTVSDQKTRFLTYPEKTSNQSTGAGIFTLGSQKSDANYYQKNYNGKLFSLIGSNGSEDVSAIHIVPSGHSERNQLFNDGNLENNRSTGGCINIRESDFSKFQKHLDVGCPVYILPEERGNFFAKKNNALNFATENTYDWDDYNFKTQWDGYPVTLAIRNNDAQTPEAQTFVKSLQNRKQELMSKFNLQNDDYNDLAILAFGVLGTEGKFGKSDKLWWKENLQPGITLYKCLKSHPEVLLSAMGGANALPLSVATNCGSIQNSRGPTQIKEIPTVVKNYYPNIESDDLYEDMDKAAITTMGFLAESLTLIKSIEKKNRESGIGSKLTRENRIDYIGYIYRGQMSRLKAEGKNQADPESNEYMRRLKQYGSYLELTQSWRPFDS